MLKQNDRLLSIWQYHHLSVLRAGEVESCDVICFLYDDFQG